ncbi:MAG: GNAT family N-acetyltransferase [Verrucomicrobia bacterium]|nr:GNAT family N-acetyltransferase [Verrucomicrobiota bacterium]
MDLLACIIKTEMTFPSSFTNAEERAWGVMYHNVEIADSYDSNHAWVRRGDRCAAVREIEAFYRGKRLVPRVYQMVPGGTADPLRPALEEAGFAVGIQSFKLFIYTGSPGCTPGAGVQFRRVQEANGALLDMIERSAGLRARKVIARRVRAADCHLLVGTVDGRPVTLGSLQSINGLTRIDGVLTDAAERGRGYGLALTHALIAYHAEHLRDTLYLYADGPAAIRMYLKAGFEPLEPPVTWYWAAKD